MIFLKKIKNCLFFIYLIFCSLIPTNFFRLVFYNLIPNFKIKNSKIGFLNIFYVNKLVIKDSNIGNFNFFNLSKIKINESSIKHFNIFCNFAKLFVLKKSIIGTLNKLINLKYKNYVLFVRKSQISNRCFFEINSNIILGRDVVFGGHNSKIICKKEYLYQRKKIKTYFEKNIFIGAKVVISSGINVCKDVVIGSSSIVERDIKTSGKYFSNRIKKIYS